MLAHKANESSFAQQNAGTEIHDSNKALRSGRVVFAVVVFTRQIRERGNSLCAFTVQRCSPTLKHSLCATSAALGIMQINLLSALVCTSFLRSFSSFAANNNSRSYSAVFKRLLLQWKAIAEVIRRQRRKLRLSERNTSLLDISPRAQATW